MTSPHGNSTAPITDSPWFWVLLFSAFGLILLGLFSGQYGKRQARLERQYQARERIAEGALGDGAASNADRREYATPENTLVPLWPLSVALCGAMVLAATMLGRQYQRGRNELPG